MSIGSPTAFLLWAILACLFFGFLIVHLWCYDRFKCVRWDSGRQPGAFKRIMTYSYLATLPLLVFFSVSIAVLKFKEGFIQVPSGPLIPRPVDQWQTHHRKWVIPLYFVFSGGWAFEIVTHLEELTFWLFLLNQGQVQREWFHSWEFRIWYLGSMIALLGMPLITLTTRYDLESCIAWIMLAGSSASTLTTVLFLYIIFRFPCFIRFVKIGGAAPEVIIRLLTFYQLNLVRVVFRFLFTIPIFLISIDGVRGSRRFVFHPFTADFLIMLSGVGCFVSSAITLFIFFPRSIAAESGYRTMDPSSHDQEKVTETHFSSESSLEERDRSPSADSNLSSVEAMPVPYPVAAQNVADLDAIPAYNPTHVELSDQALHDASWYPHGVVRPYHHPTLSHSHVRHSGMPMSGTPPSHGRDTPSVNLHPYVMNFTSPIDLLDPSEVTFAI